MAVTIANVAIRALARGHHQLVLVRSADQNSKLGRDRHLRPDEGGDPGQLVEHSVG
jgi:hypothetical protein